MEWADRPEEDVFGGYCELSVVNRSRSGPLNVFRTGASPNTRMSYAGRQQVRGISPQDTEDKVRLKIGSD